MLKTKLQGNMDVLEKYKLNQAAMKEEIRSLKGNIYYQQKKAEDGTMLEMQNHIDALREENGALGKSRSSEKEMKKIITTLRE